MDVHPETSHVTDSVRQCNSLHMLEKIHSCQDSRWIFLFFLRKQRLPVFNSTFFRCEIGSNATKGHQKVIVIAIIDRN